MNIQVSDSFKKSTGKVIFALLVFILVYLILLLAAIAFSILCVIGGVGLIIAKPMMITIVLGFGLAGLGYFITVFVFKFLFKKHSTDLSHLTEITAVEEPRLFMFIDEIVKEVETDFPKKIYLSSEVNACVFYDSSFWSMFFPIRKNLQIGVGLINTITEQEFKAILAHEFGHFSQRSMKVGSYVYHLNQIIFNMLYDNESFDTMINKWAGIHSGLAIFVAIANNIVKGIQFILRKMYEFVNISYMALSREMEFHADEVAANIAGYQPLKEALLRLDLANYSYNSVISYYENKISENVKSRNIYKEQLFVLNFFAKENRLQLRNNLPLVEEVDLSKYNKSKLNIKDQWASHPTTEERARALTKLNITMKNPKEGPAIVLFENPDKICNEITVKLFDNISYSGQAGAQMIEVFEMEFSERFNKNNFPKIYNGYYEHKNLEIFAKEQLKEVEPPETMEALFSKEKLDMVYDSIALENDKINLVNIAEKKYDVKTFDYDGRKYKAKDAWGLITSLEKELEIVKFGLKENDLKISAYFLSQARKKGNEDVLIGKYEEFELLDKKFDINAELYTKLTDATNFISAVTPYEQIESNFKELLNLEEELKREIRNLIGNKKLESELSISTQKNFEKYLSQSLVYFIHKDYDNDNLQCFLAALHDFNYLNSRNYFMAKMSLLQFQVEQIEMEVVGHFG